MMQRLINIRGNDMDNWLAKRIDDVDDFHVEIGKSLMHLSGVLSGKLFWYMGTSDPIFQNKNKKGFSYKRYR